METIPIYMAGLNPQQLEVATSKAQRIVCVAGPGSGKTKTIISRVKNSIDLGIEDADRIAMITFTNAAANEMRERLGKVQIGFVGTLHAFIIRLLNRYGHEIGYRRGGVSVISEIEAEKILTDCAKRLGCKKGIASLMKARRDLDAAGAEVALVWKEYAHILKRNNLVDYDTILAQGVKLAEILTFEQIGFDVLYVDEAQDSGQEDWAFYDAIKIPARVYVGDPDQSIYRFRGAFPAGFVAQTKLQGVKVVRLERSYRCAMDIAAMANRLIQHNPGRIEKRIESETMERGVWIIQSCATEAIEFERIGKLILQQDGSCAVLAPTNDLVTRAALALSAFGIKTQIRTSKVCEPAVSSKTLALLALAVDPNSEYRAIQALVATGVLPAEISKCLSIARKSGICLAGVFKILPPADIEAIPEWLSMHVPHGDTLVVSDRIKTLGEDATAADLLESVRESDTPEPTMEEGAVFVGTIHAAKGREWDFVAIIGLEEGLLPRKNDDIEEARRLLFVGMTRARNVLLASCCQKRASQWGSGENPPSRFLDEIHGL